VGVAEKLAVLNVEMRKTTVAKLRLTLLRHDFNFIPHSELNPKILN
jgi:hypothetical protein